MKKALFIVAAVSAYSLLETALLLSITVSSHIDRFPTLHQQVVGFGQFLLLPGMAALMSRIMYGPFQSLRRTLTLLLAGPLSIPVALAALLLFMLAIFPLFWAHGVSRILFYILLPVTVAVVLAAFVVLVRYSGKWSVKAEAARWLAERQSGTSVRDRRWRTRSIRFAVCIPVLITLPIFLFLPETWGLASHFRWPHCGELAGYRIRVPPSWYVLYHQNAQPDGFSYINGLVGRGIGFGADPLGYDLAWWTVGTRRTDAQETDYERWPPERENILGRRTIKIGNGDLKCIDYWRSYPGKTAPEPTVALVDCSGPNRLHASFNGARRNLDQFYRMLGGITEAK